MDNVLTEAYAKDIKGVTDRDKASPYDKWAQMNLEHTNDWIVLTKKNHVSAEILWFLIDHSDRYNAIICSSAVLEEALGYSRPTVARAIKFLKDNNFIDIKKSGTTNIYLINKEISWKSWGNNFKYAEFGANVLISENEQFSSDDIKTKRYNMAMSDNVAASRSNCDVVQ